MSEVTYEDAIKFFKGQEDLWEAFCSGIEERRESYIADVKRNMQTPNAVDHTYFVANGGMIALDDLLYEFKSPIEK